MSDHATPGGAPSAVETDPAKLQDDLRTAALAYHRHLPHGKIKVVATKPMVTQRDLALAYSPGVAYACEEIVADERLPDEDRSTKLPLLGTIAAGSPIEAVENREELDLEQLYNRPGGVFVLKVRGDSMIEDHLCDGDYVVIERKETCRNGDQVVALLDSGEATLKRYYKEGRDVRLQPANQTMQPRIVPAEAVKVQGVVIGVLRSYN